MIHHSHLKKNPTKKQNTKKIKPKQKKNLGKGKKESKNVCNWPCFLATALI